MNLSKGDLVEMFWAIQKALENNRIDENFWFNLHKVIQNNDSVNNAGFLCRQRFVYQQPYTISINRNYTITLVFEFQDGRIGVKIHEDSKGFYCHQLSIIQNAINNHFGYDDYQEKEA